MRCVSRDFEAGVDCTASVKCPAVELDTNETGTIVERSEGELRHGVMSVLCAHKCAEKKHAFMFEVLLRFLLSLRHLM